jgi:hypothetical protein
MKLSIDIKNTTLTETHYVVYGVSDLSIDEVISLLTHDELEMLAEGIKKKIVIRGGKKRIILKCPKGQKLGKTKKSCVRMSSKKV